MLYFLICCEKRCIHLKLKEFRSMTEGTKKCDEETTTSVTVTILFNILVAYNFTFNYCLMGLATYFHYYFDEGTKFIFSPFFDFKSCKLFCEIISYMSCKKILFEI